MMKFTVIFTTLFVCTFANPLFPHLNGYYQNTNNMDQYGDVAYGGFQQGGAQNQGPNRQAAATTAPDSSMSDSSSASSSEETTTQAPAAAPQAGPPAAPQAGSPDAGANQAGQNSGDTNMINQVDAAPIGGNPDPGNTSGQQFIDANPSNVQKLQDAAQQKQEESRQSSLALAFTTLFLVAGVAATAAVTYKYKDAIRGRLGL